MSDKRTRTPTDYERSFYGDEYRPRLNHPPMFNPSKPLAPQIEVYRRDSGLDDVFADESIANEAQS